MEKRYKMRNKYIVFASLSIFVIIIILTIGYASYASDMSIDSRAIVRVEKDIRITQFIPTSYTESGASNWEEHNVSSIYSGISLPNSNSTVTYSVQITNIGNVEAAIESITGLPSNLTYTLSGYTLNNTLCDDNTPSLCKLGSVTTLLITIGYATNGYDSNNTNYNIAMDFEFIYMVNAVARIGNTFYNTLQAAINAVSTNQPETTVVLLKNASETVTIAKNKNIYLDLNGKTLSNNGDTNVIANNGNLRLGGGTITSDASTKGAVDNKANANINIFSGSIIKTGGRQAFYNEKGTATISGTAYLSSSASDRAAVQNQANSTMYIKGGTIVSTGLYGVNNAGTLVVGEKDGSVDTQSPVIKGVDNGVYTTTNISFYDGIVKSLTDPFSQISRITDKETGYGIFTDTEVIGNDTYNIAYLGITNTVRFMGNGGTVSGETTRYVLTGHAVGQLPSAYRAGYELVGWFTAASGGTQISSSTLVTADIDYYAQWRQSTEVASIGNTLYNTLQAAINAAPANTQTTITLLKDVAESLDVGSTKNIIIDIDGHTMRNVNSRTLMTNEGIVTLTNGTLISSATESVINQEGGYLTIDGVRINASGQKQAIYITGGTAEIKGNSYITSQTNGTPTVGSNMERGTVQNVSGTLIITGGTIVGERQHAVSNQSILRIGTKDGSIDATTPVLMGAVYGIKNDDTTGTINFYDGIIKGITDPIDGTITDQETGSQRVTGAEAISGQIYRTVHLEIP